MERTSYYDRAVSNELPSKKRGVRGPHAGRCPEGGMPWDGSEQLAEGRWVTMMATTIMNIEVAALSDIT